MEGSPAGQEVFLLQFFGGPTLSRHGEPVSLSPMQGALLALLHASDGTVLSREEVIGRLWPREDPFRARRRLSQLIYSLHTRTAQRHLLRAEGGRIKGLPGVLRTDLQEFFRAIASDRFDEAWRMLAKGFLPLLEPLGSKAFCDWREGKAAELRSLLRKRSESHYHRRAKEGDWSGAAEAAEVLLALQPDDQRPLRDLLTALWRAGQEARAQEVLREFVESREEEEGRSWSPEPATLELISRMQSPPRLREPTPAFVSFRVEEEPPLVGRDHERTLIRKTLRTPPSKDLRTVLLLGEAGVGKTRMVWEGIEGLAREGQRVLTARAVELERIIPLNPLIEAFAPPWVGAVLRELEEPWRTVLYGVMPHHYPGKGPIPTPPEIQPGSVPRRLFEAVYQLLLALSAQSPLVLVVDDVQWADETTLAILQFLVRRWESGSFQLILSLRTEEIQSDKALSALLETLRSEGELLEVELGDLDERNSEELIVAVAARSAGAAEEGALRTEEVTQIRSLGAGNPLFLIELTTDFLAGRVSGARDHSPSPSIPRSLRQLVERRLARLGRQAHRVLGALAVTGRPLPIQDLQHIAALNPPDLLSAALELAELNLTASKGQDLYIRHELIRQTVYRDIDPATRSWLHRRVAEHLAETRSPPPVDELALHYSLAGLSDLARRYALEAAPRAESAGAIPEALGFLAIAREHSPDPAERDHLTGRMGHLNYLHQNLLEAANLLEVGVRWAKQVGDAEQALFWEAERVDCLGVLGKLPLPLVISNLAAVKAEAKTRRAWEAYAAALDIEIHHYDRHGDVDGARSVLRQAHRIARLANPAAACRANAILALNLHFHSPESAVPAARRAVELARLADRSDLELLALNRLIVVLLLQGLLGTDEGKLALEKADERAKKSGDLRLKFLVRQNRGVWFLEIGEYETALSIFQNTQELLRGTQAEEAKALLSLNMAEALLGLREFRSAQEYFTYAASRLGAVPSLPLQMIIRAGLGLCALERGAIDEARKRQQEIALMPEWWFFDPSLIVAFQARMLTLRGKRQEADNLLEAVASQVQDRFVTSWIKIVIERGRLLRRARDERRKTVLAPALEKTRFLALARRIDEIEFLIE